jgi:hypothetical protein
MQGCGSRVSGGTKRSSGSSANIRHGEPAAGQQHERMRSRIGERQAAVLSSDSGDIGADRRPAQPSSLKQGAKVGAHGSSGGMERTRLSGQAKGFEEDPQALVGGGRLEARAWRSSSVAVATTGPVLTGRGVVCEKKAASPFQIS